MAVFPLVSNDRAETVASTGVVGGALGMVLQIHIAPHQENNTQYYYIHRRDPKGLTARGVDVE